MISISTLAAGAWTAALIAVPAAFVAAGVLRLLPCRPATRHATWAALMLALLVLPALPPPPAAPIGELVAAAGLTPATQSSAIEASVPTPAGAASSPPPAALAPTLRSEDSDDAAPQERSDRILRPSPSAELSSPRVQGEALTTFNPSEPAMRRPRDLAGFAAPLAGLSQDRSLTSPDLAVRPTRRSIAVIDEPMAGPRMPRRPAVRLTPPAHASASAGWPPPSETRLRPADAGAGIDRAASRVIARPDVAIETRDARRATPVEPAASASAPASASVPTPIERQDATPVIPPAAITPASADPGPLAVWLARLSEVRDAVVRVPMIPTTVWAGGAAVVALVSLLRCIAFRRRLTAASVADGATRALVLSVAQECEIDRAPDVRMTDDATSPLLWCGPGERPMLVLPRRLWDELDSLGRRAVVAHELAHLRRRDHVGCWLSLLVGCLYWWHPVVWFIRRRLEEEADHSCDAWVTTLLPEARRAYATALLRARAMSSGSVHAPGPAMSLTPNRTRRFARRLTMVMSRTTRPNPSVGGVLLAVGLATGSWLASPAFAGPETDTTAAPNDRARTLLEGTIASVTPPAAAPAPSAPGRIASTVPVPPTPAAPPAPPAPAAPLAAVASAPSAPSAPSAMAVGRAPRVASVPAVAVSRFPQHAGGTPDRLDALEARITRMESLLERMLVAIEGRRGGGGGGSGGGSGGGPATVPGRAAGMSGGDGGGVAFAGEARRLPGTAVLRAPNQARVVDTEPLEIMIQSDKGEALWTLLSRPDVAIDVARDGDRILVRGPERDRMLVEAFVGMVGSDEDTYVAMDVPAAHRDAIWTFMSRSDVPIWVRRSDDGLEVEGTGLEHLVFQAFVTALADGGPRRGIALVAPGSARGAAPAPAAIARRDVELMRAQEQIAQYEMQMHEQHVERTRLEVMAMELEAQRRMLEVEAERRELHAEALESRVDQLHAERERFEMVAEDLEDAIEEAADEDAPRERLNAMRRELREVRRAAERMNREVERVEDEAADLERQHANLHEEHEHLERQEMEIEVRRDAIEAELAALEEMLERLHDARHEPHLAAPAMIGDASCEDARAECAANECDEPSDCSRD